MCDRENCGDDSARDSPKDTFMVHLRELWNREELRLNTSSIGKGAVGKRQQEDIFFLCTLNFGSERGRYKPLARSDRGICGGEKDRECPFQ